MVKALLLILLLSFVSAQDDAEIPISPSVLSGLLVVMMLGAFGMVGFAALDAVQGTEEYKFNQYYVGKEK